ncbi:TIM alpha/beta barrel enzyme [Bacteroidales bacterium]|nr:TIM alpha/beta barrel enzyme [Bacteroidales bacterium]
METNRRNFLRKIALGGAIASVGSLDTFASPLYAKETQEGNQKGKGNAKSLAQLKISFQEGTPPGNSLNEKFDYMEKLGIVGFEPGGRGLAGRIKEIQDALKGRPIKVSAICAGFEGWILADDKKIKEQCMSTSKEILAAAGELGSTGMIIVPAFNGQQSFPHTWDTRLQLIEDLRELSEFALRHNTKLILEPLNRQETFYLRTVADAAALCRDVDSDGIRCLGDFWHMTFEETSDQGAFLSGGKYLNHVHIASRKRRSMPGEDGAADNYVDGFKGLKAIGYQEYVSFECGCNGDREILVPAAVKLIREQWAKA